MRGDFVARLVFVGTCGTWAGLLIALACGWVR